MLKEYRNEEKLDEPIQNTRYTNEGGLESFVPSSRQLTEPTVEGFAPKSNTLIPMPNFIGTTKSFPIFNTNTTLYLGQIVISARFKASKISIIGQNFTDGTGVDLTLYTEDGQTRVFSITTATMSGAGEVVVTTNFNEPIIIDAGTYYIAVNSNGTGNSELATWIQAISTLPGEVTGEPIMQGTLAISAGVPPVTIDPTAISSATLATLVFRLDN